MLRLTSTQIELNNRDLLWHKDRSLKRRHYFRTKSMLLKRPGVKIPKMDKQALKQWITTPGSESDTPPATSESPPPKDMPYLGAGPTQEDADAVFDRLNADAMNAKKLAATELEHLMHPVGESTSDAGPSQQHTTLASDDATLDHMSTRLDETLRIADAPTSSSPYAITANATDDEVRAVLRRVSYADDLLSYVDGGLPGVSHLITRTPEDAARARAALPHGWTYMVERLEGPMLRVPTVPTVAEFEAARAAARDPALAEPEFNW